MKETIVYTAIDGTRFDDKFACADYEAGLDKVGIAEKTVLGMAKFPIDSPVFVDQDFWHGCYLLRNKEELDAVKTYVFDEDAAAQDFQAKEYPCWNVVAVDESGMGIIFDMDAFRDELYCVAERLAIDIHLHDNEYQVAVALKKGGELF